MKLQEAYDALGGEPWCLREWEIARMTDLQIEAKFAANRRAAEEFRKSHPHLFGGTPSPASSEFVGARDGLKAKLERGEAPGKEELIQLLLGMPGYTRAMAEASYEHQMRQWEAQRSKDA